MGSSELDCAGCSLWCTKVKAVGESLRAEFSAVQHTLKLERERERGWVEYALELESRLEMLSYEGDGMPKIAPQPFDNLRRGAKALNFRDKHLVEQQRGQRDKIQSFSENSRVKQCENEKTVLQENLMQVNLDAIVPILLLSLSTFNLNSESSFTGFARACSVSP